MWSQDVFFNTSPDGKDLKMQFEWFNKLLMGDTMEGLDKHICEAVLQLGNVYNFDLAVRHVP